MYNMNPNEDNFILNGDSYKASHHLQTPPDTEYISSYIESRGGTWNRHMFFGLQMFLIKYLSKPISRADIEEAAEVYELHGVPFNRGGWEHILNKHNGYLPVEVSAVDEGTVLSTRNVLVQMRNTDPKVPWLTNFIETSLLRAVWYPTTVATLSYHIKNLISGYISDTTDDFAAAGLDFKLHDFGSRGVSSKESAGIGGISHLVNFQGTDTLEAIMYGRRYYGIPMAGYSIPASEHSTMTAWGGPEFEKQAFENMLEKFGKPGKIFACVSDSYNIWEAIEKWGSLKEKLINSGATLVIRPDSGEPTEVAPEVIRRMMNTFGFERNQKGYDVLPPFVRGIQGDGVNYDSINGILGNMKSSKMAAENIAFGMGGALLQGTNRDTLRFAMKASAIRRGGQWHDVYKDPITDKGKGSKRGQLELIYEEGEYKTIRMDDRRLAWDQKQLKTVFINGRIPRIHTFDEVRARAAA